VVWGNNSTVEKKQMKNIKLNHKIISTLMALLISGHVLSMQQTEPKGINKKDVVDEIDRSAIEESESSQAPEIDNMMPAFEMPDFKANIKDSDKTVRRTQSQRTNSKQRKVVKKIKPVIEKMQADTAANSKTTASSVKVKEKSKPVVVIRKTLKPNLLLVNDVFVIENGKTMVHRTTKKYTYKYRFKNELPLNSKGLKVLEASHYLVIDKTQLLADINAASTLDKASNSNPNDEGISEKIILKRQALAKKYNKGKEIRFSIAKSRLKPDDIVYDFDDVQMVVRQKSGHSSAKKYWLYPLVDVKNSALFKIGNSKYKVIKKL